MQVPQGSNLTVSSANSAWLEGSYTLQAGFKDALTRYYSAQAEPITTAKVGGVPFARIVASELRQEYVCFCTKPGSYPRNLPIGSLPSWGEGVLQHAASNFNFIDRFLLLRLDPS
jgi:hypothetical protein